MKIRKNSLVLSILATTMILTGCQQTPSTTIINNTPTKDNVSGTEETIDVESLSVINMSYEERVAMSDAARHKIMTYCSKDNSLYKLCEILN